MITLSLPPPPVSISIAAEALIVAAGRLLADAGWTHAADDGHEALWQKGSETLSLPRTPEAWCGHVELGATQLLQKVGRALALSPLEVARRCGATAYPPPRPTVGVALLCRRPSGALLLGQRRGDHTDGLWAPPAGKLERWETVVGAAARELREETGLLVHADRIRELGVYTHDRLPVEWPEFVTLWCAVDLSDAEADAVQVAEPEKCAAWRWAEPQWPDGPLPLIRCLYNLAARAIDPWRPPAPSR